MLVECIYRYVCVYLSVFFAVLANKCVHNELYQHANAKLAYMNKINSELKSMDVLSLWRQLRRKCWKWRVRWAECDVARRRLTQQPRRRSLSARAWHTFRRTEKERRRSGAESSNQRTSWTASSAHSRRQHSSQPPRRCPLHRMTLDSRHRRRDRPMTAPMCPSLWSALAPLSNDELAHHLPVSRAAL